MRSVSRYILLTFICLNLFFIFQNCSQGPMQVDDDQKVTNTTSGDLNSDPASGEVGSNPGNNVPNVEFCDGSWSSCSATCGQGTQVYTSDNEEYDMQNACALKTGDTRACKLMDCGSGGVTSPDPVCIDTAWAPAQDTICNNLEMTQTSNCGKQRKVLGAKNCNHQSTCSEKTLWSGSCALAGSNQSSCWESAGRGCASQGGSLKSNGSEYSCISRDCTQCVDSVWTPSESTVCNGEIFKQVSNCNRTRESRGSASCTMVCTNEKKLVKSCAALRGSIVSTTCIAQGEAACKALGGDLSKKYESGKLNFYCSVQKCNGVVPVIPPVVAPVACSPKGTYFQNYSSEAAGREASSKCCNGYQQVNTYNSGVYVYVCK